LNNNEKMIFEYKSGKEKALNALVGQVMKASKGRANAQSVKNKIIDAIAKI
jgi:aspartyl-tRNA(Asn)/glutamyl-tRNA(Gln) amidotransferase subunit B